jgi:CDP-diacylglycerol--glycerol-3-phosphate 3-phosphatidyltransferase
LISRVRDAIDEAATPFAKIFEALGLSPNALSIGGLAIVAVGAVLVAQGRLIVGPAVAGFGAILDLFDGLVARRTGQTTPQGGFLDSVLDRYTDAFAFAAIGWYYDVTWIWAVCLLGFLGAAATSYAKARTFEDVRPADRDWGDLVERPERQLALWFGTGFQGIAHALDAGVEFLPWVVTAVAVLGHVTVLQRGSRAMGILAREGEQDGA